MKTEMSEMKHTKGPWLRAESCIYSLMQDGWRKGEPLMVNRVTISTYFHKEVSDEEREATRNLIAAAPDLLRALVRMELAFLAVLRGKTVRDADEVIAEATSARAKAQGHAHD